MQNVEFLKMSSIFVKESTFEVEVEKLFSWHEKEGVLERLTPYFEKVLLIKQTGKISTNPKVYLKVKAGPFFINYVARHVAYEKNRLFVDIQEKGPFKRYRHSHIFSSYNGGSKLTDKIEYKMPFHLFTKQFAHKKFYRMFEYRHTVTKNDLNFLSKYTFAPLRIGITGASGDIGKNLVPLLKTHGHSVIKITRDKKLTDKNTYYWNTETGEIIGEDLHFDCIIHLAGMPIGNKRWSKKVKKEIVKSRIENTEKLIDFLLSLKTPPKTFLCASAIGYYGHCGENTLLETDKPGKSFISDVCKRWEEVTKKGEKRMRVVNLRIGIVMSYSGGALNRVLNYFKFGLGMIFGKGDNYISWVSMDDLLYAIAFCIYNKNIASAVNIVSPNPVTQKVYAKTLAKILKRPCAIKVPKWLISLLYGEMGKEVLFTSVRAYPDKLIKNGFEFYFPDLENTLRHTLGRY